MIHLDHFLDRAKGDLVAAFDRVHPAHDNAAMDILDELDAQEAAGEALTAEDFRCAATAVRSLGRATGHVSAGAPPSVGRPRPTRSHPQSIPGPCSAPSTSTQETR